MDTFIDQLTQSSAYETEAVSVLVLTEDEQVARQVAPMLAARLYPARRFGAVLHVESLDEGFECAVEVLHGRPLSAVLIGFTAHTAHSTGRTK